LKANSCGKTFVTAATAINRRLLGRGGEAERSDKRLEIIEENNITYLYDTRQLWGNRFFAFFFDQKESFKEVLQDMGLMVIFYLC